MLFQLFGFSSWKLFIPFGGFQALHTHNTGLLTVVTIHLFMSALVTGISFIDFKLLFYIIINQLITIVVTILVLHCSSAHFNKGGSRVHQAKTQQFVAKVMEF